MPILSVGFFINTETLVKGKGIGILCTRDDGERGEELAFPYLADPGEARGCSTNSLVIN